MIKELIVSTALLCSASLSFSYCMGEDRIVVERKIVRPDTRPHRTPEQLPIDCIYNDVMNQVADEAYTRFPDKEVSDTTDKIEMSFLLDFGGYAGTKESLLEDSPMDDILAKYRIERQDLYGKSIRGTEERGSKMIYTY